MEFQVNKKTLTAIVKETCKAKASTLSVCDVWRIGTRGNMATLFRFFISEQISAEIAIVNSIPENDELFFLASHAKILTVLKIGKAEFVTIDLAKKTIDGIDVSTDLTEDMIPYFPDDDMKPVFSFSAKNEDFSFIEKKAVPHVSDDETRYFMMGVFFDAVKWDGFPGSVSKINIAATNGRTCFVRDSLYTSAGIGSAIVPPYAFFRPKKTLRVSAQVLERKQADKKYFSLVSTGADFTVNKITECIDGQFPQYRRIIPNDTAANFFADVKEFRVAVESARTLCSKELRRVRFTIGKNGGTVSADGKGATEKEFSFACRFDRDEYKIYANADYVLYSLPESGAVDVCFSKDGCKAFTIQNSGLAIVMPMQAD